MNRSFRAQRVLLALAEYRADEQVVRVFWRLAPRPFRFDEPRATPLVGVPSGARAPGVR
jgi:hypothetical protein